jgi:hypothetical protein
VRFREASASELLMRCRNEIRRLDFSTPEYGSQ